MRTLFTTLAIGLAAALMTGPRAISQDSTEWENLFGRDLADWSRTGDGKTPWHVNSVGTLTCSPANEMYVPEREFSDGTFKFEYRFPKTEKKTGHAAGFWVRKTLNGGGCKVSLGSEAGAISATFQGGSDKTKTVEQKPVVRSAKAIGEWNEVVVKLEGRSVSVTINGKEVSGFDNCDPKGLFALEAEGDEVEFRNVFWKEAETK